MPIRWQDSSFYLALNSPECRGTAMIIDEQVLPLQRVWCLFEVYQTIHLSRIRRARAAQTEGRNFLFGWVFRFSFSELLPWMLLGKMESAASKNPRRLRSRRSFSGSASMHCHRGVARGQSGHRCCRCCGQTSQGFGYSQCRSHK